MKKVLAVFAVLAMACVSSLAFAADVTVGGELAVRSRDFSNLLLNKTANSNSNDQMDTQTRVKIDVNAKAGDNVKGKVQLWHDFDTWGAANLTQTGTGLEASNASSGQGLGFREAWINFNIPGVPVNVTAGHQLLALGQGYFFVSRHFGSDAWVVANVTGNNTIAIVDIKAAEGQTRFSDDLDAYAILDVFKIDDNNMVGIDLTNVKDRRAALSSGASGTAGTTALGRAGAGGAFKDINLYNVGLNYTGKLGPLNLKAEVDVQSGKAAAAAAGGTDAKFKGNQIVIKGDVAMDPASINFTVARGSGNKANSNDFDQIVTILDIDPHVAFLYEYKLPTVALNVPSQGAANDHLNTGFANTTALNIGAAFAATKSLKIGANLWLLQATEKVSYKNGPAATDVATTNEVGNEIDVNINWKLYDNLAWNWNLGMFLPGKAYNKANGDKGDTATGIQGILALSF